jgi:hypothetical protein
MFRSKATRPGAERTEPSPHSIPGALTASVLACLPSRLCVRLISSLSAFVSGLDGLAVLLAPSLLTRFATFLIAEYSPPQKKMIKVAKKDLRLFRISGTFIRFCQVKASADDRLPRNILFPLSMPAHATIRSLKSFECLQIPGGRAGVLSVKVERASTSPSASMVSSEGTVLIDFLFQSIPEMAQVGRAQCRRIQVGRSRRAALRPVMECGTPVSRCALPLRRNCTLPVRLRANLAFACRKAGNLSKRFRTVLIKETGVSRSLFQVLLAMTGAGCSRHLAPLFPFSRNIAFLVNSTFPAKKMKTSSEHLSCPRLLRTIPKKAGHERHKIPWTKI